MLIAPLDEADVPTVMAPSIARCCVASAPRLELSVDPAADCPKGRTVSDAKCDSGEDRDAGMKKDSYDCSCLQGTHSRFGEVRLSCGIQTASRIAHVDWVVACVRVPVGVGWAEGASRVSRSTIRRWSCSAIGTRTSFSPSSVLLERRPALNPYGFELPLHAGLVLVGDALRAVGVVVHLVRLLPGIGDGSSRGPDPVDDPHARRPVRGLQVRRPGHRVTDHGTSPRAGAGAAGDHGNTVLVGGAIRVVVLRAPSGDCDRSLFICLHPRVSYRVVTPSFVERGQLLRTVVGEGFPGRLGQVPDLVVRVPSVVICPTALYVNVCELVLSRSASR